MYINQKKANLFIIGNPRSGTSTLRNILNQSEFISSIDSETHFFAEDLKIAHKIKSLNEYEKKFQIIESKKYYLDKSVEYVLSEKAAQNIKKYNKSSFIIMIIRNPYKWINSIYNHELYEDNFSTKRFINKLSQLINFKKNIEKYEYFIKRKRFILISFEDLVKNPHKITNNISTILEIPNFKFYLKKYNEGKVIKNNFLTKLLKILNINNNFSKKILKKINSTYKLRKFSINKKIKLEIEKQKIFLKKRFNFPTNNWR